MNESQIMIRNVGSLLVQRGFHIVASLLLAVLVPRIMGPSNYGRYVLITSLSLWFLVLTDLGLTQVMGRYIPQFRLQGEKERLQKFFSNILTMSLVSGALCACLYLLFTALWLTDLDLFLLITLAATLFVRSSSHPFFTLFLGLNQAARWGMGETFRHWFLLVSVTSGFYLGGLLGALVGLLITELVVLSIGVGWGKSYCSWAQMRLDIPHLIPYLRFGFIFFISHLLTSVSQYSGTVLIRFFYPDYVQVSYFGLANNIYLGISFVIPQFTLAFAPLMVTLQAQGKTESVRQWIEQLINGLTVGGMFVVFGVLLLGNNLVPLVLGSAYQPVAANLFPLSLTLWVQVLSSVAILLALVYNCPKIAVMSAGIRLAALWIFGPFLVAKWGSLGGCFAVLFASAICAGYLTWRMKRVMTYSLRKWASIIALGLPFLSLLWWQSSWLVNGVLYGIFVIGYCGLLLFLRIIPLSEMVAVWRALRSKSEIINWSKS